MKTLSINEAELLASKFRADNGLSMSEPVNAKTIVRKLNIMTLYRPLSEKSYGISCKSSDGKMFMMINSNSTRGRQHFTVAHELYHLFYDENPEPHMCNGTTNSKEKSADRFASALLMPKEGLYSELPQEDIIRHDVSLSSVLRLEQLFSVSRKSLLLRFKDLDLITQKRLDELYAISVKDSARKYGYDLSLYEKGNEGLVIGDFGEKARKLFEQGKISEGHYQELLNMITYARKKDKDSTRR